LGLAPVTTQAARTARSNSDMPRSVSSSNSRSPAIVYLHGLGSSPQSTKAIAVSTHLRALGYKVCVPSLRVPTLEMLSFPEMMNVAQGYVVQPNTVVIGSSLGGLTAARVAEREPRVSGLFLMAPAFKFLEVAGKTAGDEWETYMAQGWFEVDDSLTEGKTRVHTDFVTELARYDIGFPNVTVPTTIVHGVRDESVPIEHSRQFVEYTNHASLAVSAERNEVPLVRPLARLIEVDDDHALSSNMPWLLAEIEAFVETIGS